MEEIAIGPNPCPKCGGEYGEHHDHCKWMSMPEPKADHINQSVIDKISKRAAVGLKKYGVGPDRNDLTEIQWLEHAQQEAMDLAVYLEKLIQEKKFHVEQK